MNRLLLAIFLACLTGPIFLSKLTAQAPPNDSITKWVEQLGDDQFHRRKSATGKLIDAGPSAVPRLVGALDRGDLETIDRAIHCLTEIALKQPPDEVGGAWDALTKVSESGATSRASLAKTAVEEIREMRQSQAVNVLAQAGITIGIDKFLVRAISTPEMVVQIDEGWSGDLEPLAWLRWIKKIEFARVKGTAIRSEVIERLVEMPDLKTIAIVEGEVDTTCIRPLQRMERVNSLEFRYVHLTAELGDEITKIPIAVSLSLMGTGIPKEKVDQMRTQLPGLHIDFKQGGFLGVLCYNGMDTCRINEVTRGKPAEQAGLLRGDEIVGINDTTVTKFEDLQEAINQKMPGDEVEVKFRRGVELNSVILKLGKYDNE
ncbi:PDZ domain-containing protein [Planctomycetes bacterium CA13]